VHCETLLSTEALRPIHCATRRMPVSGRCRLGKGRPAITPEKRPVTEIVLVSNRPSAWRVSGGGSSPRRDPGPALHPPERRLDAIAKRCYLPAQLIEPRVKRRVLDTPDHFRRAFLQIHPGRQQQRVDVASRVVVPPVIAFNPPVGTCGRLSGRSWCRVGRRMPSCRRGRGFAVRQPSSNPSR